MNETERERIIRMLSDGTLRPDEAAKLLAALAEKEPPAAAKPAAAEKPRDKDTEKEKEKEKTRPRQMEIQMQRPDGSHYTVEVPPNLVPAVLKVAGAAIKESARTASKDAWSGFKTMVHNKTEEVKSTVKDKVGRTNSVKTEEKPETTPEQQAQSEARHRILQMVQNGRITAADASRLIQQLDALQEYKDRV